METIYVAGGCLWGVQEFLRHLPGVIATEAGRANGQSAILEGPYDGYAECVKTTFDPEILNLSDLMGYFFEIIDPYSLNRQGADVGQKYRTGIYSKSEEHLKGARAFIDRRKDREKILVEVKFLKTYIRSAEEHQDRLSRCPGDYCHIDKVLLTKYKGKEAVK